MTENGAATDRSMSDLDRLAELAAAALQPGLGLEAKQRAWMALVQECDPLPDTIRSLVAAVRERDELRAALKHIQGEGCDSAAFYGLPMPAWDTCLDYEYREDKPTGDPLVDRCHRCVARAALHPGDGA